MKAHWYAVFTILGISGFIIILLHKSTSDFAVVIRVAVILFSFLTLIGAYEADINSELSEMILRDMRIRDKSTVIQEIKWTILKYEEEINAKPTDIQLHEELRHYKRCLKLAERMEVFKYQP